MKKKFGQKENEYVVYDFYCNFYYISWSCHVNCYSGTT